MSTLMYNCNHDQFLEKTDVKEKNIQDKVNSPRLRTAAESATEVSCCLEPHPCEVNEVRLISLNS